MFVYINHSLVCETCAAAGIPDRCVHAMQYLPPWKSYFQLKAIQSMSSRKEKASFCPRITVRPACFPGTGPALVPSHPQPRLCQLPSRLFSWYWFGLESRDLQPLHWYCQL